MMENVILVKWHEGFGKCCSTGGAEIYLDYAFPSTKTDMKRLMKLVLCEYDYDKTTENLETMKAYIKKRIPDMEETYKRQCKEYMNQMQRKSELRDLVQSKKHPNGLRLSVAEWKQAKADFKESQRLVKSAERNAHACKKNIEQIKDNFEFIEQIQKERG